MTLSTVIHEHESEDGHGVYHYTDGSFVVYHRGHWWQDFTPNSNMTNRVLIWSETIRREQVEFFWDYDCGQFSIFSRTPIFGGVWMTAGPTLDKAIQNTQRLVDAIYQHRSIVGGKRREQR